MQSFLKAYLYHCRFSECKQKTEVWEQRQPNLASEGQPLGTFPQEANNLTCSSDEIGSTLDSTIQMTLKALGLLASAARPVARRFVMDPKTWTKKGPLLR